MKMFELTCPHCKAELRIPDKYAGQNGKCKHCQQQITVPIADGWELNSETIEIKGSQPPTRTKVLMVIFWVVFVVCVGGWLLDRYEKRPSKIDSKSDLPTQIVYKSDSSTNHDSMTQDEERQNKIDPQRVSPTQIGYEDNFKIDHDSMTQDEGQRFQEYCRKLRGSTFLEAATLTGNAGTIQYSGSGSRYDTYWGTGDAIRKTLMEVPIRLFREFKGLDRIQMSVPYYGQTWSVNITGSEVESFLGFNLDRIRDDSSLDLWRSMVVRPYFNKQERNRFERRFISSTP